MSNRNHRRSVGQAVRRRAAREALACLLIFLTAGPPAVAQVGHDPAGSPFRDITTAQGLTLFAGRFTGARANAQVYARPGAFAALRLETKLTGPLDLYGTFSQAYSNRFQVFPGDTANRVRGPIDQTLNAFDLAVVLNITGPKRWHAFAPYAGVGFGLLSASPGTSDPGGFRVGSNFIMAPVIGSKIFLSRTLALRVEARDFWLRYEWPLSYYFPTDSTGGGVAPVLGEDVKTRQVTHNYILSVGLSYLFNF